MTEHRASSRKSDRPGPEPKGVVDLTGLLAGLTKGKDAGGTVDHPVRVTATRGGLRVTHPLFSLEVHGTAGSPLPLERAGKDGIQTRRELPTGERVSLRVTQEGVSLNFRTAPREPQAVVRTRRRRGAEALSQLGRIDEDNPETYKDASLHNLVRYYRNQAGHSQVVLAGAADLSRPRFAEMETGARPIREDDLDAIIGGFGWEKDDKRAKLLREKHRELQNPEEKS